MQTEYSSEQIVRSRSLAKYRQHAKDYDTTCGPTWPIRERAVAALVREIGFGQVSVSHEVSPLIKLVGRLGAGLMIVP